jgi:hypothetical protein
MARLLILSTLMVALLAGCGQMIVFGHVVREGSGTIEPQPASPAPASAAATTVPAAPATASTSPGRATSVASASAAPGQATTASSATPAEAAARAGTPAAAASSSAHAVKAVNLVITPEAAARATGDASRFTADALLDAIKAELRSRKLLDEHDPHAAGTAEVVVDGLGTRPTSNAILFGYKMLAGTLEGDIRVKAVDGTESTGSRIVALSKLTLAAEGDDKNPLGPLYKRFAVLAADRLAGLESRSPDSASPSRY